MKRLDLILNGKGGVGKSFFAVNFVQYLKDRDIAHVAIDSDNENSTLKRFHPDAQFLDLTNRREPDVIFRSLERANLVVVDCRAGSSELFLDYFVEIEAPAVLKMLGAVLTLVMPVNHELDSVDQVQRLTDQLGKTSSYVVVRNAAHSDSFALYESTEVHTQIKGELNGREIVMHRLQDWLVEALSRENLTITAATKHPAFSLLDRQRIQIWQRRFSKPTRLHTARQGSLGQPRFSPLSQACSLGISSERYGREVQLHSIQSGESPNPLAADQSETGHARLRHFAYTRRPVVFVCG